MEKLKMVQLPLTNPLTAELDSGGIWHQAIFFGIAATVLAVLFGRVGPLGKRIAADIPLEFRLFWAYVLVSALYLFEYPSAPFGIYNTAFQVQAAQAFTEALLIPVGALFMRRWVIKILPAVVLYELICIWVSWNGLFHAPSFNSAFCALAIPFLPVWLVPAVLVTILSHHGSTAVMIVVAQLLAAVMRSGTVVSWLFMSLAGLGSAVALFFTFGHFGMGTMMHRLHHYEMFMTGWAQEWQTIVLGTGPGSFLWISFMMENFKEGGSFFQMHSDWLQILFENGVIGFALSFGVLLRAMRNAWDQPKTFSALFGGIAFMLPYHPWHYFPSALLMSMILVSCMRNSYRSRQRRSRWSPRL